MQTVRELSRKTLVTLGARLLTASTALRLTKTDILGRLCDVVKHGSLLKSAFDPISLECVDFQRLSQVSVNLTRETLVEREAEITNFPWRTLVDEDEVATATHHSQLYVLLGINDQGDRCQWDMDLLALTNTYLLERTSVTREPADAHATNNTRDSSRRRRRLRQPKKQREIVLRIGHGYQYVWSAWFSSMTTQMLSLTESNFLRNIVTRGPAGFCAKLITAAVSVANKMKNIKQSTRALTVPSRMPRRTGGRLAHVVCKNVHRSLRQTLRRVEREKKGLKDNQKRCDGCV